MLIFTAVLVCLVRGTPSALHLVHPACTYSCAPRSRLFCAPHPHLFLLASSCSSCAPHSRLFLLTSSRSSCALVLAYSHTSLARLFLLTVVLVLRACSCS